MENQAALKKKVALAALSYVPEDLILGVGTGSTINYFIDYLSNIKERIKGAIPSSMETAARLKKANIPLLDFNEVSELPLYIDSADAFTAHGQLIKGGGGALTREKILAYAAQTFICLVDESKESPLLDAFPIAIEVIPMARSYVAREVVKLGGRPVYRPHFVTDNGNVILDVHHWTLTQPMQLERRLNQIPGVVSHGLFAERPADLLLISRQNEIQSINPSFFKNA